VAVVEQATTTDNATRRNELLSFALSRWAQQEPVAAIEYIDANAERLGIDFSRSFAGIGMQGDLRAILAAADSVRPALATIVRRAALPRLAREDPRAATLYLESLDLPSAERMNLASQIAGAYVDVDVEGALAWVRGQPSHVELPLLLRLAQSQPQRAVELALASQHPETVARANQVAQAALRTGGVDPVRLADLFLD